MSGDPHPALVTSILHPLEAPRRSRGPALARAACLVFLWLGTSRGSAVTLPVNSDPAPNWIVQRWETENGLPENSATAMVQTADGYLWFGTFNGLVRFDGVKFTVFDTGNTPELPSSGVVNLHLDRAGRLWVSTLRGLVVREESRWRTISEASIRDGEYVRSFVERANGDLLLTLSEGRILERSGDRCSELSAPPGKANAGYQGFTDEEGRWWVAQHEFVGTWNGTRWLAAPAVTNVPVSRQQPLGVAPARGGGFWLLAGDDLRRFSLGRQVSVRAIPNGGDGSLGSISRMTEDRSGNVWIATFDAGLTQVLPDGSIRRWNEANGLAYKDVRFVFEDREGNLWVGTSGGGLQRFREGRFQAWSQAPGNAARLVNSVAAAPDGSVWATTFGQGLFHWGPEEGFRRTMPPGWADHHLHFTGVLAARDGRTWIGVYADGLIAFGPGDHRHFTSAELGGPTVNALFEDRRGRIWISAGAGVAMFEDGRFQIHGERSGLPPGNVCAVAEDADGILWLSNLGDVFRFQDGRFGPVRRSNAGPLREVTCLIADTNRTMWLGTSDRGLLRWRDGVLAAIDGAAGLPVRSVHGIMEDDRGVFWLTSNRGIVRVQRSDLEAAADGRIATLTCQLLDTGDGLPSVECPGQRQPVCARDTRGRLWFATAKGLACTDPARFQLNGVKPVPLIERLSYQTRRVQDDPREPVPESATTVEVQAPFPSRLVLPAGSRRLEIHYTAPSFTRPDRVRFEVRLDDRDPRWRSVGGRRVAYFDEIAPGEHVFRVRAANDDGVWSDTAASVAFAVSPRFWQTVWFRVAVGSAVAAEAVLIAGLVLLQRRRRRVEAELQLRRTELAHVSRVVTIGELTASLAHELNHPQSAILSNAQAGEMLLNAEPPDLDEARRIFADIVRDNRRANQVLQRLRAFLRKREMEFEPVDLNGLVRETLPLIESDAAGRGVVVRFNPAPVLPPVRADRVHLQQVLLNLLLNAMDAMAEIPAGSRELRVETRLAGPDAVGVAVTDSGPGIPADRLEAVFEPFITTKPQGMGMGLSISRTIIEAHRGSIWAEGHPGRGATLRFTLPAAGAEGTT